MASDSAYLIYFFGRNSLDPSAGDSFGMGHGQKEFLGEAAPGSSYPSAVGTPSRSNRLSPAYHPRST